MKRFGKPFYCLLLSRCKLWQERKDAKKSRALEIMSGRKEGISFGLALGMSIAVVLSWSRNASILWAMLHGFLNWIYVIYFAITR